MAQRSAGFTLLEIMLVMLLLGVVASLIVATLPAQDARVEATKLTLALNQAAERAQTEGQFLQLELRDDGWQIRALAAGDGAVPAPLPGYYWQPVTQRWGHLQLPSAIRLRLLREQRPLRLPATLLFTPDGDTPTLKLELQAEGAAPRLITWHHGQASEEPEK